MYKCVELEGIKRVLSLKDRIYVSWQTIVSEAMDQVHHLVEVQLILLKNSNGFCPEMSTCDEHPHPGYFLKI